MALKYYFFVPTQWAIAYGSCENECSARLRALRNALAANWSAARLCLNQVNDSYNSGPHPFPTSPDASAASHLSTRGMNNGVVSKYAAKRGSEP